LHDVNCIKGLAEVLGQEDVILVVVLHEVVEETNM
jgi:hypothetical protein